ncbi:HEAT repeat [Trypanosoma melophagium]|uniref:HEAT repeat n=1 Tax=Trypanosoma melophagium TaxID=715481 RepID=UPI00351A193C|nr:HEAT repeat [Trypanosoma melophagium]
MRSSTSSSRPSDDVGDTAARVEKECGESPPVRVVLRSSSINSDATIMNTVPGSRNYTVSHELGSAGSSPPLPILEETSVSVPGVMSLPILDTGAVRRGVSDSAELNSADTAERSTTTNSSQSPAAVNPLRSMNPAFSLSPRTASSSGYLRASSNMPNVILRTDKDGASSISYSYAVGTVEGRRNFVAECLQISEHMSTQTIVEELLPAMLMVSNYDDAACAIARILPDVLKQVQGLDENIFAFFMGLIMNMCCSANHEVVRQISSSLETIISFAGKSIIEVLLFPLVNCMRVSFWSSPRAVAAALLGILAARPAVVKVSEMSIKDWFNSFIDLARDKSQFVREVAVSSLYQWVLVAEVHRIQIAEMPLSLVHECMRDGQSDTVRYTHVAALIRLAEAIGKEASTKYLRSTFTAASKDKSWRVRYIAAKNLAAFARLCMRPDDLLSVFAALCLDDMKETRAVAIEQLGLFADNIVSQEVLGEMSVIVASLATDAESVVRESVSNLLHVLLSPQILPVYTLEQRQALFALLTDDDYVVGRSALRNLESLLVNLAKYLVSPKPRSTSRLHSVNTDSNNNSLNTAPGITGTRTNTSPSTITPATTTSNVVAVAATVNSETSTNAVVSSNNSSTTSRTTAGSIKGGGRGEGSGIGVQTKYDDKHMNHSPVDHSFNDELSGHHGKEEMEDELRERASVVLSGTIDYLHIVSDSKNWRIREAVVDALRHFCMVLSREEFVPLTYIIRSLLRDPVSVVRLRASETLAAVANSYGPEWAAVMAFDFLQNEFVLGGNTPYTWRVVAIQSLSGVLPVVSGLSPMDLRRQELMQRWMRLVAVFAEDEVSNVRLALAKSIAMHWDWYIHCVHHREYIYKCVERLQRDSDMDVCRVASAFDLRQLHDGEPF